MQLGISKNIHSSTANLCVKYSVKTFEVCMVAYRLTGDKKLGIEFWQCPILRRLFVYPCPFTHW